eukprot:UN28407
MTRFYIAIICIVMWILTFGPPYLGGILLSQLGLFLSFHCVYKVRIKNILSFRHPYLGGKLLFTQDFLLRDSWYMCIFLQICCRELLFDPSTSWTV